jgi:hypothetical protein
VSAARPRRTDRDAALAFPHPDVAEALAASQDIPVERAHLREPEFRRWFVAVAASPVMIGICSQQVDAFWHELLGRSALYEALSGAINQRSR